MPSQLAHEDAQLLLDIIYLRRYAEAKRLVDQPDTDTETLLKAGLSQSEIDQVMDNIAAAQKW